MAYAEKRGKGPAPWRARFKLPNGKWDSEPGFPTKAAALDYGRAQETDVRRGDWRDPERGRQSFADWSARWVKAHDVAGSTMDRYRSILRINLNPRWDTTALADIKPIDVKGWIQDLESHYKPSTIGQIRGLFLMILDDAVSEGLIDINPASVGRRRGKWVDTAKQEKTWASAEDVIRIAENVRLLAGQWSYVLVILAAYTGMRWGELVGLEREYIWFDGKALRVEWQLMQRDDGTFEKLPPKYGSRRTLLLPPFLTVLLRDFLATLPEDQIYLFLRPDGCHPRRQWFNESVFKPAIAGREASSRGKSMPRLDAVPDAAGMTPHGFRHGHKVWIDEDGATRVAAAARMGHRLRGVEAVYSHVSRPMEAAIVAALQRRWEAACRPDSGHGSLAVL
jgi:integrase